MSSQPASAVITGAGTGIGRAIARVLAEEQFHLFLVGRRRERLEETASELRGLTPVIHMLPTDVTVEQQVVELFRQVAEFTPRLSLLVNNAGTFEGGPLHTLPLATWQHVLNVNLTAPFLCSREALRLMRPQRGGRIINIGSISAQMPRSDAAAYAASKHGLVGLTRSTALEGREFGISASCLHPGNVMTERRAESDSAADQEPMMSPAELAEVVRTMALLPPHINLLESIVLPVTQAYVGRG